MTRYDILCNHLKTYESDNEPWKADHHEVMENHDTADALSENAQVGTFLYNRLRKFTYNTFEGAAVLCDLYTIWYAASLDLIRAIEKSEQLGFKVDKSEEFKNAVREAGGFIEEVKGRKTALRNFIDKKGVKGDEFVAQLRSHCGS